LAKQKPHRRLAVGFGKNFNESEPDCRATQQQRAEQKVQIQITIHEAHVRRRRQVGQFHFWFTIGKGPGFLTWLNHVVTVRA